MRLLVTITCHVTLARPLSAYQEDDLIIRSSCTDLHFSSSFLTTGIRQDPAPLYTGIQSESIVSINNPNTQLDEGEMRDNSFGDRPC